VALDMFSVAPYKLAIGYAAVRQSKADSVLEPVGSRLRDVGKALSWDQEEWLRMPAMRVMYIFR
jgi:hypothetical protein